MKVLVVGGSGMLGHKLVQVLSESFDVSTTIRGSLQKYEKFELFRRQQTFENINVENIDSVKGVVEAVKPNVLINAIGVIKQIPTAKDTIKTLTINSIFPHRLAELAREFQFRLINIGTDCVFSGNKGNYVETDVPDASDLYGKSKQLGEVTAENCLTLRTSIIGRELFTAHSLVEWFLSNRDGTVKGYRKAVFSGFPTIVLAEILANIIENHPTLEGLYHVSSQPINKHDLLNLIKKFYRLEIEIEPFDDFQIDRSLDSTKFRRATGFEPSDWSDMIERMAEDNALYQK
jgi:dTDP-4-dehydrorhamnose reductase